MSLRITELKAYVPAKDFAESKRFYQMLGFTMSDGWGGTADFALNGQGFRLQDYYVKEWADNFMFVIRVEDVEQWHRRAQDIVSEGGFANVRFSAPEPVDGALVLHIWDPCGVLLIFVQ